MTLQDVNNFLNNGIAPITLNIRNWIIQVGSTIRQYPLLSWIFGVILLGYTIIIIGKLLSRG